MTPGTALIEQLEAWHADAFSWAAACSGGDVEAGADALQEAYVRVATGRARFSGQSSLKTWWLGVVRYTALEQRRGLQRWQRVGESFREWIADLAPVEFEEGGEESRVAPDAEGLAAALQQLSARQGEVLHLVFQQGLSVTDAAAVMAVSVGSARQHYDRAKRRLRSLLTTAANSSTPDHAA